MNMDLAVEFIPNGKYRWAKNIRAGYSDGDNLGVIESALGNIEITNIDIPLNANESYKCVGKCRDKTANKLYYLLWNSAANHRIMEYDPLFQSLNTVMIDEQLNFSRDFLVTGINVVYLNPDTPLLYWTDGGAPNGLPDPVCGSTLLENPPRMLNINKAKGYMQGVTNPLLAYQVVDVQTMDAIKWMPTQSPLVAIVSDNTTNKNVIKTNLFQFAAAYGYDNYQKSALSPISEVVVPKSDEVIDNAVNIPPYFNNAIDVTIFTGAQVVEKLYIYVRKANTGQNALGDFYLAATIDKYDENGNVIIASNAFYTYRFYNNKTLEASAVDYTTLLYDYLPKTSKAQEYIDGNMIVYPNVTEQFDLVKPNVTVEPFYNDLPDFEENIPLEPEAVVNTIIDISNLYTFPTTYVPQPYDIIQIGLTNNFQPIYLYYIVTNDDVDVYALVNNLIVFLAANGIVSTNQGEYYNPLDLVPMLPNQLAIAFTESGDYDGILIVQQSQKYSSFKSGATHPFAICYADRAGRLTTAILDEKMSVYAKYVTEQQPPSKYIKRIGMRLIISHKPPVDAVSYRILYAKNSTAEKFIFTSIKDTNKISDDTQLEIMLNPLKDFAEDNPNSILSYTYSSGDYVRITTQNDNFAYQQYLEVPVAAYDEGTFKLTVNAINLPVGVNLTAGSLIEIVTPKKLLEPTQLFYYEISQEYFIGNAGLPTRYHTGNTQNQSPSGATPAIVELTRGDVWVRPRKMTTTDASTFHTYWVEDYNYSDFYISDVWDRGKPNIYDPSYSQVSLITKIPFSGQLIPNTKINDTNRFYPQNYKEYNQAFRSIQFVRERDRRLYCFHELKVTIIPISQRMAFDANSNAILAETDQVLNPAIPMSRDGGIGLNPESFCERGNAMYYVDTIHGEIIRISQDGQTVISDYGLHNFTTDLFSRIQSGGGRVNIYGEYNERFEQAEFAVEQTALPNGDTIASETFAFFEDGNYWTSFYEYYPDMISSTNSDLVTFKNGRVWLHNKGLPANYYGVQYNSEIEVISNQDPKNPKVWHSLNININQPPSVPNITTQLGQVSFLNNFGVKEGKYYKDFKRDILTVGKTDPYNNGNRLRGRYLSAIVRIGSSTLGRLFSVTFNYKGSPLNTD